MGQSRQWYLSEMDPVKPGTSKDIDFYCCSSSSACPPSIGWRKIGKGHDPAPVSVAGNSNKGTKEAKWDNQLQADSGGPPVAPQVPPPPTYPYPTGSNIGHWTLSSDDDLN